MMQDKLVSLSESEIVTNIRNSAPTGPLILAQKYGKFKKILARNLKTLSKRRNGKIVEKSENIDLKGQNMEWLWTNPPTHAFHVYAYMYISYSDIQKDSSTTYIDFDEI